MRAPRAHGVNRARHASRRCRPERATDQAALKAPKPGEKKTWRFQSTFVSPPNSICRRPNLPASPTCKFRSRNALLAFAGAWTLDSQGYVSDPFVQSMPSPSSNRGATPTQPQRERSRSPSRGSGSAKVHPHHTVVMSHPHADEQHAPSLCSMYAA